MNVRRSALKLEPGPLIDLLAHLPPGEALWVPGLGRSMRPLLRSGDALQVERCGESGLRPGDLALLVREDDALTAHVVLGLEPLRTANLRGVPDEEGGRVIGRAVALRVRGAKVPYGAPARLLTLAMVRAFGAARSSARLRRTVSGLRRAAEGPLTRPVRAKLLAPLEIRPLTADDAPAVIRFTSDLSDLDPRRVVAELSGRWAREQLAFGAFDRRGRLRGFVYVDEYGREGVDLEGLWVRYLLVAPLARRLGLGGRLLDATVGAAARLGASLLHADIRADNEASRRLFRRHGFAEHAGLTAALNTRRHGTWVAVARPTAR